ncbi:hypothetical protein HNP38_002660 [Chryseobacterium defluvii]|uniref:Uncharacterized protein n=1 Tax=Chryseobacterium defluvii TaxID=160396 RepID=A0A840KDW2_9FLAO|nr:hypothetical protein [Chryseobacterium defluvii]MBB4807356.1 hypothetical protein [Chryseobacterium defluvii]
MIPDISYVRPEKKEQDFSEKLNEYFQNKFCSQEKKQETSFPEESYISSWEKYCERAMEEGALSILRSCYPQFHFPIEEGVDKTQVYAEAVLKGKTDHLNISDPLNLNDPDGLKIKIHESIAGKIPVLVIPDAEDFIKIIQCILYKNNPFPVPLSMGALLANGVNNWDRIRSLKREWTIHNPLGNWNQEFSKNILPVHGLYKDKLVILSTKPYSNVPARSLGLADEVWESYSFSIRLEHECAHLYTLKRYGQASNNLHDELIADYIGISKAAGSYRKEWMLAFMGLEEYPRYRKGARLENYIGDVAVSSENFEQLIDIIKNAIDNIAEFDEVLGVMSSDKDQMYRMDALCETDLLEIASRGGAGLLIEKYNEIKDINF